MKPGITAPLWLVLIVATLLVLSGCSRESYSELQLASSRGQTDLVKVMLDRGADVNETTRKGKTPLMLAAAGGRADTVSLLLERQAHVDAQDADGMTALMVAASGGHTEVVNILLDRGANLNMKNTYGATGLASAVFFGHAGTAKALLSRQEGIDKRDAEEALLIAAGLGHEEIIGYLLGYGVNPDCRGKNERTPLMAAIAFGHVGAAKSLIKRGADLAAADAEGQTALALAESKGEEEIAKLLRAAGAKE